MGELNHIEEIDSPEADFDMELLLEAYDDFLLHVESLLGIELSDNIKNKNINIFRIHMEGRAHVNLDSVLARQLKGTYNVYGPYFPGFIDTALKKRREEIIVGKQFVFPGMFYNEGANTYDALLLLFLENKDKWWSFPEAVKDFVNTLLVKPEIVNGHN